MWQRFIFRNKEKNSVFSTNIVIIMKNSNLTKKLITNFDYLVCPKMMKLYTLNFQFMPKIFAKFEKKILINNEVTVSLTGDVFLHPNIKPTQIKSAVKCTFFI